MGVFRIALGAFLALFLTLQPAFGGDALPPCDKAAQSLVSSLQQGGFEMVGVKQIPIGELAYFTKDSAAVLVVATPSIEAAQKLEKEGWTRVTECQSKDGSVLQILRHEAAIQKPGGPA